MELVKTNNQYRIYDGDEEVGHVLPNVHPNGSRIGWSVKFHRPDLQDEGFSARTLKDVRDSI